MNNYELFESYIFDKLSEDDRLSFEQKLESDQDFLIDFEEHKKVQEAMDVLVEDDIIKVIENIDESSSSKIPTQAPTPEIRSIIPRKWMSIAAAVLFLLAAGFLMKDKFSDNPQPMAMSEYYEEYKPESDRGIGKDVDLYESYGKAINQYIDNEQWTVAAEKLQELMSITKGTATYDQAEWNLATVYAQYNAEESIAILQGIINDRDHTYHKESKVKKLLDSLSQ